MHSFFYNADRQKVRTISASGRTVDAGYDSGGRPTGFEFPEASIALTYGVGDSTFRVNRIVRTPAGGGAPQEIGFSYDGSLVIGTTFSGTANGHFSYSYNNGFSLREINFSSGADTFNRILVRDHDNLIINDGPFTFIRSGPEGRASAIQDGILSIAFVYDNLARMTSRTHTVNGQIIYRIQFGYDAVGRLLQKVETAYGTTHTFSYAYDVDGQLTGVNRDGVPFEIYAYDLNGNRVSAQVGGGPVEAATYNAQDQLVLNGTFPTSMMRMDSWSEEEQIPSNTAQGENCCRQPSVDRPLATPTMGSTGESRGLIPQGYINTFTEIPRILCKLALCVILMVF